MTGTLPTTLGDLEFLRYLFVNANRLTGTVPVELGNLFGLEFLVLEKMSSQDLFPLSWEVWKAYDISR